MVTLATATSPAAVIDVLNGLLEAEQNSIFRFLEEGSPYLNRTAAELRRPLAEMVQTSMQHINDLADLIDSLGGTVAIPRVQPEDQYLAFLTFKFLLPKLIEDKKLTIERYENAIKALGNTPAVVIAVLQSHIRTHREQLAVLEKAAAYKQKTND